MIDDRLKAVIPAGHARYQITTRDLILKIQWSLDACKILHDKMPVPYQQLTYRAQMTDALRGKSVGDLYDAFLIIQQVVNNWQSIVEEHKENPNLHGGLRP